MQAWGSFTQPGTRGELAPPWESLVLDRDAMTGSKNLVRTGDKPRWPPYEKGMRVGYLLLGLSLMGCVLNRVASPPSHFVDAPTGQSSIDRSVREARRLRERGDARAALVAVEAALEQDSDHIDGNRLRQDLLRQRGRLGLLLCESKQRLAARPDDAIAHYLHGRVTSFAADKKAMFERATELLPDSFWGWLGLAFSLRANDPEGAIKIYRELYSATSHHPLPSIALASSMQSVGQFDQAIEIYDRLRQHPLADGIGELGLARALLSLDKLDDVWDPLTKAIELRPFDPGVHSLVQSLLAQGLSDDRRHQMLNAIERSPSRAAQFGRGGGAAVLANLYLRSGDAFAARSVLEDAGVRQLRQPSVRRLWNRVLLATGDLAGFLRSLREFFPPSLLVDETNEVRGLWITLLEGPWVELEDPLSALPQATQLIEALMYAGLIEEAVIVGSMAWSRYPHGSRENIERLRAVIGEARRELVFERSVRRLIYRGYGRAGQGVSLDGLLTELSRLSLHVLGRDVVGEPEKFHLPVIGDLVNPFSPGLGQHFARYNKHLVLGQRSGGFVEGMLLTRLSVRVLPPVAELPLPSPCWEVIGESRTIQPFSGIHGGDLAGVALINHYIIDMDSVRDWANDLLGRREVAREDGEVLLADPLPEIESPLAPVDAVWRLTLLSPVGDSQLQDAVLDMIRWHERAHLVDFFHFLPLEQNLWRVAGLLLRHGFRSSSIEAELEARAETAALAMSPHTGLVMAHLAGFLGVEAGDSPHAAGFGRLVRRLQERAKVMGISEFRASRWHLMEPEMAREIGRGLLGELW